MYDAVMAVAPTTDIVIMSAAVADFRPVATADQKLKKADGAPTFALEPTVDILFALNDLAANKALLPEEDLHARPVEGLHVGLDLHERVVDVEVDEHPTDHEWVAERDEI